MEAPFHHADEEGKSEIRVYDVDTNFLDLNDIYDGPLDEMPVLAIDPGKVERIKSGATKTVGKKKLRLKRGITTMDTGAGADINNIVSGGNRLFIVLHNNHGVAEIPQTDQGI